MAGLIFIDASARRSGEFALYKKRTHELEQAKNKLRNFEESDHPLYFSWFQVEFAEELQALTAQRAEVLTLTEIKICVEDCAFHCQIPLWQAYMSVQAAIAAGKGPAGWYVAPEEDDCELEDAFEDFSYEEDIPWEHFEADEERDESARGRKRTKNPASNEQIKGIYHQLARLLHPDMGEGTSAENTQLWHEVQQAYHDKNLLRLQQILHALQSDSPLLVDFSSIAIGEIMALRSAIERQLRQVRRELAAARTSPSWNFRTVRRSPKRLHTLRQEISNALLADSRGLNREHTRLSRLISLWEQPRTKAKSPASKRRVGRQNKNPRQ
jgi:hypothetical protein